MNAQLGRLSPFIAPFAARLGASSGVVEIDQIQPEEVETLPPVAMLPGQLDRVSGTDEHSTLQMHLDGAIRTQFTHAPVLRKRITNAIVAIDGFGNWRYVERYGNRLFRTALTASLQEVDRVRYCHSYVAWRYFGHWLCDAIPMSLIDGAEAGVQWLPGIPTSYHAAEYRKLLNLPTIGSELLFARELVFYQDHGQGSHKRQRYAVVQRALQDKFGGKGGPECVFIARGRTGVARPIRDEARLIEALTARGWRIVDIARASIDELLSAICNSRVVVGIEGSHLCHAQLALGASKVMIVLQPNDRFSTVHLDWCNAHRVSAGFVVLEGSSRDGYTVNLEEVLRTIDLATDRARLMPPLN